MFTIGSGSSRGYAKSVGAVPDSPDGRRDHAGGRHGAFDFWALLT